jgi:predicted dienelactone hydrolase
MRLAILYSSRHPGARYTRSAWLLLLGWLATAQALALPDPQVAGPYAVGHETVLLVDPARHDRALPTDIWYPAPADSRGEPKSFYRLQGPIGIPSTAAVDGLPVAAVGGQALVVFSHGSGSLTVQSKILCETLASHGFFVIAPGHTGNTQLDIIAGNADPLLVVATNRPLDVSFAIDHMLARNSDPADPFFGTMDPERVGVTGHSFGGFTAVAVAGGYADVPPDSRVKAIVSVSGATRLLADEDLANVTVPTLHLGGTNDDVVPIAPSTWRAFDLISTAPADHYRIDIVGPGHYHFANICDIGDALTGLGIPKEQWSVIGAAALLRPHDLTCVPPTYPIAEAQRLQNLYTIAFFRRYLLGEAEYDRFLSPRYARRNEPDVRFFRKDVTAPPRRITTLRF